MSLAITSRIVSGVVIVDIAGRLCFLSRPGTVSDHKAQYYFNVSAEEAHAVRSVRTNAVETGLHAISAKSSLP